MTDLMLQLKIKGIHFLGCIVVCVGLLFNTQVVAEGSYQVGLIAGSRNQPLVEYDATYSTAGGFYSQTTHPLYIILNSASEVVNISLCGRTDTDDVRFEIRSLSGATLHYTASLTTSTQANLCSNTFAGTLNPPNAFKWAPQDSSLGAGTYQIRLYNDSASGEVITNNNVFNRFDITITPNKSTNPDPKAAQGRLFAYNWAYSTGSFSNTATSGDYYVLVPGGRPDSNYVWLLDLQNFTGYAYDITANHKGVNTPSLNPTVSPFSVATSGNTVSEFYPIYLSYPFNALPLPTQPPVVSNFYFIDSAGVNHTISPAPATSGVQDTGTFIFNSDTAGTYALIIDVNSDGIFGNTVAGIDDIYLTGTMAVGSNSVPWSGRNNAGTVLPNGVYQVQLQARLGEYHFVANDVETSGGGTNNGLTIYGVTTTGSLYGTRIYWDDLTGFNPDKAGNGGSTLPDGQLSVVGSATGTFRHTWGSATPGNNGFGDTAFVDTYTFGTSTYVTTPVGIETVDATSSIGVAKTATVNGNQVTFDFYLENLSTTNITSLSLVDNLDAVFGSGNYTVTPLSTASVISTSPTTPIGSATIINVNTAYNGSNNQNLLLNTSILGNLGKAHIRLVVTVNTFTDRGHGFGNYRNSATLSSLTALMSDVSSNGTDPDVDPVQSNGLTSDGGTGTNDNDNNFGNNTSPTPFSFQVDFGDAPDAGVGTLTGDYQTRSADGGPSHLITANLSLGSTVDGDSGTLQNTAATADDTNGSDDEDGVTSFPILESNATGYSINVDVTNTTGSNAYLVGYLDFNRDGDFLAVGERSATVIVGSSGSYAVNFSSLTGGVLGNTYIRFRLSSTQTQAESSVGAATSGEVEDYMLPIQLSIRGTVFEDVNYGGGAGRSLFDSSGVARSGVRVELYDSTGAFQNAVLTNASGQYSFGVAANASYTVRVVNNFVTSSRTGGCTPSTVVTTPPASCTQVPVQTFRLNNGSADTNRIGGEVPAKIDAAANTTSATLSSLTTTTTAAQSISSVTVTTANVTGVDFGYNFDTIVNTNDSNQGSLRQFITNSNALGGESSLAQSGSRLERVSLSDTTLSTASLPAGKETSIFMIPSAQLVSGVASINVLSLLPAINNATTPANAENTIIDGTTQSVNIGNTNSGTLGTGGTVGVDALTLPVMQKPEVEITDGAGSERGIDIQASNVTVRGIAMYGFGNGRSPVGDANIRVGSSATTNYTGTLIEENILGIPAASAGISDPVATTVGRTGGDGFIAIGADSGTFRYNLTAFNELMGAMWTTSADSWTITGNESRNNGISATVLNQDGFSIEGSSTGAMVTGNLSINNGANGIEFIGSTGRAENNTISSNGMNNVETPGIRIGGTGSFIIYRNIITANTGAGVMVRSAASGTTISQNSIYANGTIGGTPTNQIGIDLHGSTDNTQLGTSPFVSLNDDGDTDTGGNGRLNFPVIESAEISGTDLLLEGWARPGVLIELFIANPDPTGFGEGQTYLTFVIEGSTGTIADNDSSNSSYSRSVTLFGTPYLYSETTNRFSFTIPLTSLPGVVVGTQLTATATCLSANSCNSATSGSTSEFSAIVMVTPLEDPKLGLAKALERIIPSSNVATNYDYTLVYHLTLENFGDVDLNDLEILDDVAAQFSGLNPRDYNLWLSVPANVASLSTTATLTLNTSWDGSVTSNILDSSQNLAVGASGIVYISFVVTVNPTVAAPNNQLKDNSAIANGTTPSSTVVSDTSTDGIDPDPDGNNDPSENDATPASFVKLIKEVRNCGTSLSSCSGSYVTDEIGEPGDYLEYRIHYYNISSQPISMLEVSDTLVSETPFQEDTYSLLTPNGIADFSVLCPDSSIVDIDRGNAAITTTPVSGAITGFDVDIMHPSACNLVSIAPTEQGNILFKVRIP